MKVFTSIKFHFKKTENSAGYSLIELIIVLVLIGVLTAMVTPFLITTISKAKLKTSAKEIATTLRFARNQAITTKKPYYFFIDLDQSSYWISTENATKDNQGFYDYKKLIKNAKQIRTISNEVIIEKVEAGSSVTDEGIMIIPFFPQGNTVEAILYLKEKDGTKTERYYEVLLDEITGKVKIAKR